jgi:hypothetical protein
MNDITIIYYTSNYITDFFMENVKKNLINCIGDTPLISVSQKQMNFGKNICVGDIGRSHLNIYRQMLIGAKEAKTPYIALAEDDIFYSKDHFTHRPSSMKVFAYDYNRWGLYTWDKPPFYSFIDNLVVNQLISSRDYFVEAIEERFNKFPDESKIDLNKWKDPGRHEDTLGVTVRHTERFDSKEPSIVFSHEDAFGYLYLGSNKGHGKKRENYLAPWGSAEDMMKLYKRRE